MASNLGFSIILQIFFLLLILRLLNSHASNSYSHHKVESLPGFSGPLPFSLETGYIGVDREEAQLFYYFFESENNPKEDPLIMWLTGGPLCSAMSAILYEIGPIQLADNVDINDDSPKLVLREHSWTKIANILFVDFPAGAGFSYATTPRANRSGDLEASHNIDEFLRKWLMNHPQFLLNPLYLGGDSYTGFTLPLYFVDMVSGNERGSQPFLNLKGYILGNPATDRRIDSNYQVPFAHGMGLISDEFYELMQRTCGGMYHKEDATEECRKKIRSFEWGLLGIQITMTLENFCDIDSLREHKISGLKRRILLDDVKSLLQVKQLGAYKCRKEGYLVARNWMNEERVQEAFHVHKGAIGNWIRCNYAFNYSYEVSSSVQYHIKLSAKGFRSLIYSGDHDMIVPFLGTQAWIRSLNYSIVDDWRKWWVDGQIAGFTRTYANKMTFATVKGAGHTAPEYKPKQCASMFKRWVREEDL